MLKDRCLFNSTILKNTECKKRIVLKNLYRFSTVGSNGTSREMQEFTTERMINDDLKSEELKCLNLESKRYFEHLYNPYHRNDFDREYCDSETMNFKEVQQTSKHHLHGSLNDNLDCFANDSFKSRNEYLNSNEEHILISKNYCEIENKNSLKILDNKNYRSNLEKAISNCSFDSQKCKMIDSDVIQILNSHFVNSKIESKLSIPNSNTIYQNRRKEYEFASSGFQSNNPILTEKEFPSFNYFPINYETEFKRKGLIMNDKYIRNNNHNINFHHPHSNIIGNRNRGILKPFSHSKNSNFIDPYHSIVIENELMCKNRENKLKRTFYSKNNRSKYQNEDYKAKRVAQCDVETINSNFEEANSNQMQPISNMFAKTDYNSEIQNRALKNANLINSHNFQIIKPNTVKSINFQNDEAIYEKASEYDVSINNQLMIMRPELEKSSVLPKVKNSDGLSFNYSYDIRNNRMSNFISHSASNNTGSNYQIQKAINKTSNSSIGNLIELKNSHFDQCLYKNIDFKPEQEDQNCIETREINNVNFNSSSLPDKFYYSHCDESNIWNYSYLDNSLHLKQDFESRMHLNCFHDHLHPHSFKDTQNNQIQLNEAPSLYSFLSDPKSPFFIFTAIIVKLIDKKIKGIDTNRNTIALFFKSVSNFSSKTLLLGYSFLMKFSLKSQFDQLQSLLDMYLTCCVVASKTQIDGHLLNEKYKGSHQTIFDFNYLEGLLLNTLSYNLKIEIKELENMVTEICGIYLMKSFEHIYS